MKEELKVEGVAALLTAGKRLLEIDPARFAKILAACRAYVAAYDCATEPDDVFASRLAQIRQSEDMFS